VLAALAPASELLARGRMRHALLIALLLPACAMSSDHTITGLYDTSSFDSPPVYQNGELTGASVVVITARDPWGDTFDQGTFHDPTQAGAFSLTVPDGADKVHLIFVDRTGDNMDHQAEYVVIDPVYDDLDVGTVYLP
jgi:hypothetical protein